MENEIIVSQNHEVGNPFSNTDNFEQLFKIGKQIASSALVPQAYRGNATDCVIAIDMANRMGVSPLMVMQNLYVVQGKPQWSGQACAALITGSGVFKNLKPVYVGTPGDDGWGCYAQATRVTDGEIVKGSLITIKMAKDEKWYEKAGSKWKTMPEQMLAYRAFTFFARVHIPSALMGVAVEGEVEDITPLARRETHEPFQIPDNIEKETEELFK